MEIEENIKQGLSQANILLEITERYREAYIREECVLLSLLVGDGEQLKNLRKIDWLYSSIQTSLQFQQHKRAFRYMIAFVRLCRRTLGDAVLTQLRSYLSEELATVQLSIT